jgi:hypothetical protein
MPYTLTQHRDSFHRALVCQQPIGTRIYNIKTRLVAFQRDAHQGPRPDSRPAADLHMQKALRSLREGPVDLLDDLRFLWFDPMISAFTDADLGRLTEALVAKYTPESQRLLTRGEAEAEADAPEILAVHTAEETLHLSRVRATVQEADTLLAAAHIDLDKATAARAVAQLSRDTLKRHLDAAEQHYRATGAANAKRPRPGHGATCSRSAAQ